MIPTPRTGPGPAVPRRRTAPGPVLFAFFGLVLGGGAASPVQAQDDAGCNLCHGELELLRQHVPTLAEAQRLAVTSSVIAGSAHEGESCASCHGGYDRWPHPDGGTTETCVSCHEEAGELWESSLHAHPGLDDAEPADCASCHGSHDIRWVEELREDDGIRAMNATCVSCHETQAIAPMDPHGDTVSCAGCHVPHATKGIDDAASAVAPLAQPETCGACHEEAADAYPSDGHGSALAEADPGSLVDLVEAGADAPPTCTSCHGGHGMVAVDDTASLAVHVDACASCHADEADRYFGTYHGKATALGSHVVATCDDCHGAHGVYASTEPESWVHESTLIETCGACHEHARDAFVAYDSHPDPMDPDRNFPLFLAFVFMNTLLIGVLIVFGLHTFLWWVRILLDRRKAQAAGGTHG